MNALFDISQKRYQPDPGYIYAADSKTRVDQRKLAFFVGLTALGLPFAMLLGSTLGACFYDSISHYYYAQFWGDFVVGALFFIGTFLIVYRGANSSESKLATLAGFAAYSVAVLPTSGRGCPLETFSGRALADFERFNNAPFVSVIPASDSNSLFELFSNAATWHFVAAAILFAFLAYYAFFVFTRVEDGQRDQNGQPKPVKQTRNRIYIASGALIVFSIAAMGLNALIEFSGWDDLNLTFWFEALALWAFGVSWMVKGRFLGKALLDDQDRLDYQSLSG